jgi:hypothetical protein
MYFTKISPIALYLAHNPNSVIFPESNGIKRGFSLRQSAPESGKKDVQ